VSYDSAETVEDWCAGTGKCTSYFGELCFQLSLSRAVFAGPGEREEGVSEAVLSCLRTMEGKSIRGRGLS